MSSSSNESFIPKRGEVTNSRRKQKNQVYLFTIISYVLICATLLAAGGVFLYSKYVDAQLEQAIAALNQEVSSFNEADMQEVQDFHGRLSQAKVRLENAASVAAVLEAVEASTVDSARFTSLVLSREDDSHYKIETRVETDTFDSTLFQRGVLERSDAVIESVFVDHLQLRGASAASNDNVFAEDAFSQIGFATELIVPLAAVPYVPDGEIRAKVDELVAERTLTPAASTSNQITP